MRVLLACLALTVSPVWAAPNQLSEVRVDVNEDAQPLRDVLGRLQRDHALNYVVNEQVLDQAGTVTVRLRDVPLDIALESICSACGLSLEIRGPVLVILPKLQRQGPLLPEVEEGLTRARLDPQRTDDDGPRPPAPRVRPPRVADEPEQLARAVGKLEEVNKEEGRLTLLVDGVRRNFYVPDSSEDTSGRVERLRGSIHTLKPGTRIALQYRRHPTRPEVTDLVGGAYRGTRRGEAVERDPRDRAPREPRIRQGVTGNGEAEDVPGEERSRPGEVLEAAGILFGTFEALDGEQVTIKRADGALIDVQLPSEDDAERRERILKALEGLEPGKRIGVTYEDVDGRTTIQDTITQAD